MQREGAAARVGAQGCLQGSGSDEERRGRQQRQWEMVEAHGTLMSGAVGGN